MFKAWYWSLLRYVQSLVLEPVAICSKLGIGACCDTFKAWYWSLLRYVQSLVLEPVAIHSKLGTGACCDTFKAWHFAISFKIGIKNVATRFKLGMSLLRYVSSLVLRHVSSLVLSLLRYVSSWVLRLLYISTHYCFHSTDFCTSTACTSTIPVHNVGALMCVSSSCVPTVYNHCAVIRSVYTLSL